MKQRGMQPAAVVGSGPNGLAAAVTLARAGIPVTVFEAAAEIGGGTRTTELIQPGVWHDVCAAIHPMALATGFFHAFQLERRMKFVVPEVSYANPILGAAQTPLAYRDLEHTAAHLGADGPAYARLLRPLLRNFDGVVDFALGGTMLRRPQHLGAAATLAARMLEVGTPMSSLRFKGAAAPALLQGAIAHSIGPMPSLASAAVGLLLAAAGHQRGWPVPVGGSRAISDALADDLRAHGGKIVPNTTITSIGELEAFGVRLFDTSARNFARIAASDLPDRYRRQLERFRYGSGACKVDLILSGPIPWRDPLLAKTATVHLGGNREQVIAAERAVHRGQHASRPVVLVAQPTAFDPARNPVGVHTVWAYAHVPHGSTVDVREQVIRQIEEFAPGVRELIVGVHSVTAADLARYNPNYHGGDFSSGALSLRQLVARPMLSTDPWRSPSQGTYLVSSSTSPGPGVHGLSGWYAAQSALRHEYGINHTPFLGVDPTSDTPAHGSIS